MIKDDLTKRRFIIGSIYIDTMNNRLFIKDKYKNDLHEVKIGTTLLVEGKGKIIYYKTEQVGYFLTADDGKQDISNFQDIIIWLPKEMDKELKNFLYRYIEVGTLNEFDNTLKKYDVTLYDCISFIESHEEINSKELTGVNSMLFHSKTTHGYCYVVHKFIIGEEQGIANNNTFEFIDMDGQKHDL